MMAREHRSMNVPMSERFRVVELDAAFNARRSALPEPLRTPGGPGAHVGLRTIRGMPFAFGGQAGADVILLDRDPVSVELDGACASYALFVHVVEDVASTYRAGLADDAIDGTELGELVSVYELQHDDDTTASIEVRRRFAIQQGRYGWGSGPFACVPAADDAVLPSGDEAALLGRPLVDADARERARARGESLPAWAAVAYGDVQQVRLVSALNAGVDGGGALWIYALPVAAADTPLRRVTLHPRGARSAVYAITLTDLAEHPLRPRVRRKLRLRLPDGVQVNDAGSLDEIAIDLGTVISVRVALDWDPAQWEGEVPALQPTRSRREVIVEYAAHPQARLHVGGESYALDAATADVATAGVDTAGVDTASVDAAGVMPIAPADRPVRLRFVDAATQASVAVRLHMHGAAGEYLPPRGYHRKVDETWGRDVAAEFVNAATQHCYVDGECVADLPLGTVYVEISRGYEIAPLRTSVEIGPQTDELRFELERVLRWRERGWVSADTHVHFLSPQTALLEGRAEDVNVVNLLASQWGEMFSNVGDFDGRTTFGAQELGGSGEFLVRVGSENRMSHLGHVSLLGYAGELIHPLCTGGPDESAFGDPLQTTMAQWAQRCIDQGGLVVMPHAPLPQLERAADIVLGLVHAVELMTENPLHPAGAHLSPYGIADWYRYLNLGFHVPLVGGSDKMSAAMLLGGVRTYARIGEDRPLTYEVWMDAIRAGNTFATVGPLASLRVEDVEPGGLLRLPTGGGAVQVEWDVESVRLPIDCVEVVVGGLVAEEAVIGGERSARGCAAVRVTGSTWVALRVRGSYRGRPDDIAVHTSAVQVLVDGSELFSEPDATTVLDQIQGALAYVDTLAPRPDALRFRELRATLERAYDRLHRRMHAAGVYHRHPLHDAGQPHEH
jgi:hypothetical protein